MAGQDSINFDLVRATDSIGVFSQPRVENDTVLRSRQGKTGVSQRFEFEHGSHVPFYIRRYVGALLALGTEQAAVFSSQGALLLKIAFPTVFSSQQIEFG